jgi:HK97 family phage major capsid protein
VPTLSNWFIEDAVQDPVQWIMREYSRKVSTLLATDVIEGDGSSKCKGILATTPELAGDHDSPARTWGAIQYVKTGNASGLGSLDVGSPPNYPQDTLYDCIAALRPAYRRGARWLMNSNVLNAFSKLHDADGRNLVSYGLREGEPDRLLGYPVTLSEQMSDLGSNNFIALFGNFGLGYMFTPIGNMVSIPDRVTTKGYLLLYLARRYAGALVDPDAFVAIRCEA